MAIKSNTGMVLVTTYALLYIVNAVGIYLAHMFFPSALVLGTFSLSTFWSIFLSMNALTLIHTTAIPFAHEAENKMGRMLTNRDWMILYFIVNFAGLWLISRFSGQFGLGISHWYVAAILALGLDMVQGIAMVVLQKKTA